MTTLTAQTTQVYSVFILATPEQIWEAITKPEFTERYFDGVRIDVRDGRPCWRRIHRGGSSTSGSRPTTRSWRPKSRAA